MTPKKCMSIAKSLTDTQHMELEPLCTVLKIFEPVLCTTFLVWIIEQILRHMKGLLYGYLYVIRWSLLFLLVIKKNIAVH